MTTKATQNREQFRLMPCHDNGEMGTLYLTVAADTVFLEALSRLPHLKVNYGETGGILGVQLSPLFDQEAIMTALAPAVEALIKRRGTADPGRYTLSFRLVRWGREEEGMYSVYLQQLPDEQLMAKLRSDPATRECNLYQGELRIFFSRYLGFDHKEYMERVKGYLDQFLARCSPKS